MKLSIEFKRIVLICIFIFLWGSCSSDYTPKPRTFLRIDLPTKEYTTYINDSLPYTFDYPTYAKVTESIQGKSLNIDFPGLNGIIYVTYRPIDSPQQMYTYIDSSYYTMFKIHKDKTTGITEKEYEDKENQVYGVVYEIKGVGVASPYQFYVTDKKNHFLRGALYFHNTPNNDSLAPVIHHVKEDIEHLISTLYWKEKGVEK